MLPHLQGQQTVIVICPRKACNPPVRVVSEMPSIASQALWELLGLRGQHAVVEPEIHNVHVVAEVAEHDVQLL